METMRIPLLTRKGDVIGYTLVDTDMYAELSQFTWRNAKGYVSRGYRDKTKAGSDKYGKFINVWMHRVVLGVQDEGLPAGYEVDHINRNPWDNRRENLRIVTHRENMDNLPGNKEATSSFKGVHWDQVRGAWVAQVRLRGSQEYLGKFPDEFMAFQACEKFRAENGLPLESEVLAYA